MHKMLYKLHAVDGTELRDTASFNSEDIKKSIADRVCSGAKKTRIAFVNHDTGEVLGEYENKILLTGSAFNAKNAFGADYPIDFITYNEDMGLDNSDEPGTEPTGDNLVCLFCIADTGCGSVPSDVYVSAYTDRIQPPPANPTSLSDFDNTMMMPFRFVDMGDDLDDDLRRYYFGRKTFNNLGKIGYYFKSFDTEPQMHIRFADGTQITSDFYNTESDQVAECYIESRMRITRLDFRDYFEEVLGWDKARISCMSLCLAWPDDQTAGDGFIYYQDILPYTLLNFSYINLVDANVAVDILYQIYY